MLAAPLNTGASGFSPVTVFPYASFTVKVSSVVVLTVGALLSATSVEFADDISPAMTVNCAASVAAGFTVE